MVDPSSGKNSKSSAKCTASFRSWLLCTMPKAMVMRRRQLKTLNIYYRSTAIFGEEFQQCLCEWHNSTTASFSPAQMFFGRKLHIALPALDKQYMPPSHFPSRTKEHQCDIKIKAKFDQHAKKLPPLRIGQKVRIQEPVSKNWDTIGTMTHKRDKSYSVLFPNGRIKLRNRCFLKPVHGPEPAQAEAHAAPDTSPCPLRRSPRLKKTVSFA